ncbi:hypothetical protein HNR46_003176 [Haloferula luteola]|uniref:Endonuclease/exonuclease/phosphatase domain-containing protein n=1 Tax=Haloferula luteola TaxID=595692 RepID=A0A840V3P9_9BACT|nr:endonuclease/exonuclease/phosphatase family protein [Haloferula luteola]MBB5352927.1 hypothetical protein [Haloferula luteola]
MRRWIHGVGILAAFATALALVAHAIGDALVPAAVISYATPWPVLGAAGAVTLGTLPRAWRLLALPPWIFAAMGWFHSSHPQGPGIEPQASTFLATTWNAGRTLAHHPEQWHFEAEVVVIIESGEMVPIWSRFREATPDYDWARLDTGMLLGVRGNVIESAVFGVEDRYRCTRSAVELRTGETLDVIAVDISSQPWRSKREPLEAIFRHIPRARPTLVLGDFNTPQESRLLEAATAGRFRSAHRTPHEGLRETWPWELPLLAIDHIWASPELPLLASSRALRSSDHRALTVQVQRPN